MIHSQKRAALVLSVSLALISAASGQSRPTRRRRAAPPAKAPKKKEKKKDKKPDRFFAVHAGQVYTVSGGVLRDVTILSKNGKIVAIGRDLDLPKKTEVLDAKAYRVYRYVNICCVDVVTRRRMYYAILKYHPLFPVPSYLRY